MRPDEWRPHGAPTSHESRRNAAQEIRAALVDMSVSLEELLPILEAARSLEATLRTTLGRLGTDTPVVHPLPRPRDFVPAEVPAARPLGATPESIAAPAPTPAQPVQPQYLVDLDAEPARHGEGELHSVAVVISGPRGPVDLARVHAALDSIAGVENLRLGRYDRTGVVVYVETSRNPSELPLQEALSAVFAEGVTGRWAAPDEYLATVGAA